MYKGQIKNNELNKGVYDKRSCRTHHGKNCQVANTYLLGIFFDFGLAPEVSMYHSPPVILTGKGFMNDNLTSKSLPILASPRVI